VGRSCSSCLQLSTGCGWSVGVELVAGLHVPERPDSQQRHFLQAPEDVFVCSVLIYVQHIRGFTMMRCISLRFTYLLTYLLTYCGVNVWSSASWMQAEPRTKPSLLCRNCFVLDQVAQKRNFGNNWNIFFGLDALLVFYLQFHNS